jgi:hypothetical protein
MKLAAALLFASLLAFLAITGCGASSGFSAQVRFQTPTPGTQRAYAVQVLDRISGANADFTFTKTYRSVNANGTLNVTVQCSAENAYCTSYSGVEDSTGHLLQSNYNNGVLSCRSNSPGEGLPFRSPSARTGARPGGRVAAATRRLTSLRAAFSGLLHGRFVLARPTARSSTSNLSPCRRARTRPRRYNTI